MSLQIPTTAELNAALIATLEAAFGQTIPIWAKAFLRVFPKSLAGLLTILYKYGGSIFLQMFVQYAGTETITVNGKRLIPLVEWGRLVGAGDPTPATRAEYDVNITVINQVGSLLANTAYINRSTGVTYLTLADVALSAPTVVARIRAYRDPENNDGKGAIGNLQILVQDPVYLVSPLPNVESLALPTTEIVTGVDAEAWEAYRQRVIDRFRSQPQGGAPVDYRLWGVEVAGIIRIYPYKGSPGEVDVYSEADTSISSDGIPTAGQLTAVDEAIQLDVTGLASRRPISSYVNSLPITRSAFDVTISGLQGAADMDALEELVEESLDTYFWSREPYIPGLSLGARLDRITKAAIGGVIQDTASAYGAIYDFIIVDKVAGPGDFSTYVLTEGEKAKSGTISFV